LVVTRDGGFSVTLELPHPPSELFRFLADPHRRPLWQASLRAVTDVDPGEPRVGMRWRDVTKAGIRPSMQLTELTPYRILTERGTWRGIEAVLTLRFVKTGQGTRITAEGDLVGRGVFAPVAAAARRWAPETIRTDLLHASAVLLPR
jgi:uncharacterized protein YndB with AHSA1/START domain